MRACLGVLFLSVLAAGPSAGLDLASSNPGARGLPQPGPSPVLEAAGMPARAIEGARGPRAGDAFPAAAPAPEDAAWPSVSLDERVPAPPPPRTLVVLDPGHGGEDLGAVVSGVVEKEFNLAIALRLKASLERAAGVRAVLTRDSDVYIPLDRRIEAGIGLGAALFVSLHANQVRDRRESGIIAYSFGRTGRTFRRRFRYLPVLPAPGTEQVRAGAELAAALSEALRTDGFEVEPRSRAEYYVLKNPVVPSVLIELGFLSNRREAAKLTDPAYQQAMADSLARGIRARLALMAAAPGPAGASPAAK